MPKEYGYVKPKMEGVSRRSSNSDITQTSPQGTREVHDEKLSMPPLRKGGAEPEKSGTSNPPPAHYSDGSHEPEASTDFAPGEQKSVKTGSVDLEQGN